MTEEAGDVPDVLTPADRAFLKAHAATLRRLVDYYSGLPRPLTVEQRAGLDTLIASVTETKVAIAFLTADSPGEALRAALGDLTPPTRSS